MPTSFPSTLELHAVKRTNVNVTNQVHRQYRFNLPIISILELHWRDLVITYERFPSSNNTVREPYRGYTSKAHLKQFFWYRFTS